MERSTFIGHLSDRMNALAQEMEVEDAEVQKHRSASNALYEEREKLEELLRELGETNGEENND